MWRSELRSDSPTTSAAGRSVPGKGEMVTFSLDGTSYEIDLTAKNASVLRKELRPLAGVSATKDGFALVPRRARDVVVLARPVEEQHAAVLAFLADVYRRWSADSGFTSATHGPHQGWRRCSYRQGVGSNGYQVRERGRCRSEVLAAFEAANCGVRRPRCS